MTSFIFGETIIAASACLIGWFYNNRIVKIHTMDVNPPCNHVWVTNDTHDYFTRRNSRDHRVRISYRTCKHCGETDSKRISDII